jgi:hypothetical protein
MVTGAGTCQPPAQAQRATASGDPTDRCVGDDNTGDADGAGLCHDLDLCPLAAGADGDPTGCKDGDEVYGNGNHRDGDDLTGDLDHDWH